MVPSLPLRLKRPDIPKELFCELLAASEVSSALSVTLSTKPRPNVGVGMRNTTLLRESSPAKSGCRTLQPGASARPVITNSACTPPSGDPSRLRTKRASRTGPFCLMKEGTVFVAPSLVATATCGLTAGADPPVAGCEWQPTHESRLKRGPRPSATPSTSSNVSLAASNKSVCSVVSPGIAPPAPAVPPRTPGSFGPRVCAGARVDKATDASRTAAVLASEQV